MKNSQPTPDPRSLNWDNTPDEHMSRLDFARYFCTGKTSGMLCGVFTGGGRCVFHRIHKDSDRSDRVKKYSGPSKAYAENKGSEEVNED